jgi:hypothetical protein
MYLWKKILESIFRLTYFPGVVITVIKSFVIKVPRLIAKTKLIFYNLLVKQFFQSECYAYLLPYCINYKQKGFVAEAHRLGVKAKLNFWKECFLEWIFRLTYFLGVVSTSINSFVIRIPWLGEKNKIKMFDKLTYETIFLELKVH